MRFDKLLLSTLLAFGLWSCGGDEDLSEGKGAGEDTGASVELDATPLDSSVPDTEMDTGVDSTVPDTMMVDTTPIDTGVVDTSMPDTTPVMCITPSDCGADTECGKRTCVAGTCGLMAVAADTPTTAQTKGDCKKVVCDGAGGTKTVADAADVPADKNECSSGACIATGPTQTPKASGTTCTMGGSVCDGAGNCVGCVTASTCPGTDGECGTRTCTSNKCGMSYASDFTFTLVQVPGDCKMRQCDGMGGTKQVAWPSDVPADDGNPCTRECCTAAGDPAKCAPAAGTKCNATTCDVSRPGICGECNVKADCPAIECRTLTACTSNRCVYTNVNYPVGTPAPKCTTSWGGAGTCGMGDGICYGIIG